MAMASEHSRMMKMMELDRAAQGAMMRAMPGTCTDQVVSTLVRLRDGYRELQTTAQPSDMLVTVDTLNDRVADITEWIGRAHDSMNQVESALPYLREARQLYADLGKQDAVARLDNKIGETDLHIGGNVDGELERLRRHLDQDPTDTVARAKIRVQLGELLTKAGDDFEAEEHLLEAERLLTDTPNLSPGEILKTLADSVASIMAGTPTSGTDMPIVKAIEVRGLYQRLYLALGNVSRHVNPSKAKQYEEKLAAFENQDGNEGLDTMAITKLMEQFSKGFGI